MSKRKRRIISIIFYLVLAIILSISLFINRISLATGNSMGYDKACSYIILKKPTFERNSLAVFEYDDGNYIKRIVGIPGDTVEVSKTEVVINGTLLVSVQPVYLFKEGTYELEKDDFFVLGDNYLNSDDSRYFGPIDRNQIVSGAKFYKNALDTDDLAVRFLNFFFINLKHNTTAEKFCK